MIFNAHFHIRDHYLFKVTMAEDFEQLLTSNSLPLLGSQKAETFHHVTISE